MKRSLFAFPAGRRSKWLVFAAWLLAFVIASAADLPGKFEEAESNEATSYLPGDAESTHALDATESLQKGEIAPAVIIYRNEGGLTAADRRTIEADVGLMTEKRFPGVIADGETAAAGGKPQQGQGTRRGRSQGPAAGLRDADEHGAGPARRLCALRRPRLLAGRQGGDPHLLHQGRRRGRTDRRPGPGLARQDRRPRTARSR